MATQSVANVSRLASSLAAGTPGEATRVGSKRRTAGPQLSGRRGSKGGGGSRQQSSVVLFEDRQQSDYFRKKIEQQYKVERSSRSREVASHRGLGLRAGSSQQEANTSLGGGAESGQRPGSRHRFTPNSSQ